MITLLTSSFIFFFSSSLAFFSSFRFCFSVSDLSRHFLFHIPLSTRSHSSSPNYVQKYLLSMYLYSTTLLIQTLLICQNWPEPKYYNFLLRVFNRGWIFHRLQAYSLGYNYSQIQLWCYTCWTFHFSDTAQPSNTVMRNFTDCLAKKNWNEKRQFEHHWSSVGNLTTPLNFGLSRIFKPLY